MQEETNEKTIALYIKTGKLTAQQLQKAMKALLAQMKKQHDKQKIPHGKQTLKQLMKQNAGVSNIEITKDNIKAFESTAKKYGIDFALKKDTTESPPRYLVFFKGRDADVLTAAFQEFSARKLTQEQKPSIRKALSARMRKRRQRNRPQWKAACRRGQLPAQVAPPVPPCQRERQRADKGDSEVSAFSDLCFSSLNAPSCLIFHLLAVSVKLLCGFLKRR